MKQDTGFWVVITLGIVGIAGYWAYNQYVKPKVDTTTKFLGIF